MPAITLTDPFLDSNAIFEKYPVNVILEETYGKSRVERIRNRLEQRTRHLFVDDASTHIAIKDVSVDGRATDENLSSDLEIQEWLGLSPTNSGKAMAMTATKKDPRCRFVFLLAESVFAPLSISVKSATRILTYHQVSPYFFEFLDVYGCAGWTDRGFRFTGFRTETHMADPQPGTILPELGRSGRRYQICFNIKTVVQKERINRPGPGRNLWQIRQDAIHHQFDVGSGVQLWIYGDPHAALKGAIAEIVSDQRNHKDKFDTVSASFKSSLRIHLQSAKWSTEGWRQYITWLEEALDRLTSLLVTTSDDRLSQLRQDQPHYVQQYEDWINDSIMTLESNADNMNSLCKFYTSVVRHDDFPVSERHSCGKHVENFNTQIEELIYNAKMQIRRAVFLQKMMADRKATCVQLLQAQAARQAVQLSATMLRQAEQTSHEAVAMRIITIITLIYLPPTFVSVRSPMDLSWNRDKLIATNTTKTLFSTDIVKYQGDDGDLDRDIFSSLALQRFLEFSLPLMLLTFTVAFGWLWYEKILARRKAKKLAVGYPEVFGPAKPETTPDPSSRATRRRLEEKSV